MTGCVKIYIVDLDKIDKIKKYFLVLHSLVTGQTNGILSFVHYAT